MVRKCQTDSAPNRRISICSAEIVADFSPVRAGRLGSVAHRLGAPAACPAASQSANCQDASLWSLTSAVPAATHAWRSCAWGRSPWPAATTRRSAGSVMRRPPRSQSLPPPGQRKERRRRDRPPSPRRTRGVPSRAQFRASGSHPAVPRRVEGCCPAPAPAATRRLPARTARRPCAGSAPARSGIPSCGPHQLPVQSAAGAPLDVGGPEPHPLLREGLKLPPRLGSGHGGAVRQLSRREAARRCLERIHEPLPACVLKGARHQANALGWRGVSAT